MAKGVDWKANVTQLISSQQTEVLIFLGDFRKHGQPKLIYLRKEEQQSLVQMKNRMLPLQVCGLCW